VPPLYITNPSPININIGNNNINLSTILNEQIDFNMIIKIVYRTQSSSMLIDKNQNKYYYVNLNNEIFDSQPALYRVELNWGEEYTGFYRSECNIYRLQYDGGSHQSGTDYFDVTICKNAIRSVITIPINWSN
jgi:hypothetical protein